MAKIGINNLCGSLRACYWLREPVSNSESRMDGNNFNTAVYLHEILTNPEAEDGKNSQ